MGKHESKGVSDEWYTPKYIFDALEVEFDLDVAHPRCETNVPAKQLIFENSLSVDWFGLVWFGLVWMNPPWCDTKDKINWCKKFINHGNGIALMPDSTSANWWQFISNNTTAALFVKGRVKFIKPDGTTGDNPANGTTLFAIGDKAVEALQIAAKNGLGKLYLSA